MTSRDDHNYEQGLTAEGLVDVWFADMTTRATCDGGVHPNGVMPAPPRRGDAPAAPNDGGCIEGRLDAGEGAERCRTGAHGGPPDLRSAADR